MLLAASFSALGMYDHIKSLKRIGAVDTPHGASAATAPGCVKTGGVAACAGIKRSDTALAAIRTNVTTVGRGTVATLAGGGGISRTAAAHLHADSFQRRKGVVNTIGGAKDVTRQATAVSMIPHDPHVARTTASSRIATLDTLDTLGPEGIARRKARDRRDAAQARAGKSAAGGVHVIPSTQAMPAASKLLSCAREQPAPRRSTLRETKGSVCVGSCISADEQNHRGNVAHGDILTAGAEGAAQALSVANAATTIEGSDASQHQRCCSILLGSVSGNTTAALRKQGGDTECASPVATVPSLVVRQHHERRHGRAELAATRAEYFDRAFAYEKARKTELKATSFMVDCLNA